MAHAVQFALSPYWFCTPYPNKIPQFIFLSGLLGLSYSLSKRMSKHPLSPLSVVLAVLGSHGFAIQFGTAMMDIPMAYLAAAAIDSLMASDWLMGGIELAFLVWYKPFTPIQTVIILLGLVVLELLRRRFRLRWTLGFCESDRVQALIPWQKVASSFIITSLLVAGPFVTKSLYYVGTPLFPFGSFTVGGLLSRNPFHRQAILEATQRLMAQRTAYGEGHDPVHLLTHFWKVAVPSEGVNNRFDYPLGLPYLLCLGPFVMLFWRSLRDRRLSLLAGLAILYWATWWAGSEQSRWLYIPVWLMFVTTLTDPEVITSRLLRIGLTLSCLLVSVSIYRTHARDFRSLPQVPIRTEDRALLEASRRWQGPDPLIADNKLIAFSEAPTRVVATPDEFILRAVVN